MDRLLELTWKFTVPRWRALGKHTIMHDNSEWWRYPAFVLWGVLRWIKETIEHYHFDLDHPERWQKG